MCAAAASNRPGPSGNQFDRIAFATTPPSQFEGAERAGRVQQQETVE
jgi:hypothetical protein